MVLKYTVTLWVIIISFFYLSGYIVNDSFPFIKIELIAKQ
jgi:hypothetical protein